MALSALGGMVMAVGLGVSDAQGAGVTLTTLASFNGSDGASPKAGLVLGSDGLYYGTTIQGGTFAFGTVFKITTTGALSNLVFFNGTNGARPFAGLALGFDNNFYGTTWQGGSSNLGTVFRITTNGALTTLISFSGTNGSKPAARLLATADGNFYGTTFEGGVSNFGTVYRITSNGVLTTLASFTGTNGANPYGKLIQGADGFLYGTTVNGGIGNWGTIFKTTTNGALTVLYPFDGLNGASPYGGLLQESSGILYGSATYGGGGFDGTVQSGNGTVFQLTTNGAFQLLHAFNAIGSDGANPQASLVKGSDSNLYGTTILGGTNGYGTVFQITTNGTFTSLVSFNFDDFGAQPYCTLATGAYGALFGTTYGAGANGKGTVFRLDPVQPKVQTSKSLNTLTLSWDALPGQIYQVQYKTNLNQASWLNLGAPVTATNTATSVSDSTAQNTNRYYRVVMPLVP
jgi:uncharacterized repeat protein (TIGR03803 family)